VIVIKYLQDELFRTCVVYYIPQVRTPVVRRPSSYVVKLYVYTHAHTALIVLLLQISAGHGKRQ